MKVFPLTEKLRRNIMKLKRANFRVRDFIKLETPSFDTLIVIGDGNLDGIVAAIIAHHMNGAKTVAMTIPECESGYTSPTRCTGDIVLEIVIKSKFMKKFSTMLFITDQKDAPRVGDVFRNITCRLENCGVDFTDIDKTCNNRVKAFKCKTGDWAFNLVCVVNGLDDVPSEKHCIEDHLVKVRNLKLIDNDSKKTWWALEKSRRYEILGRLSNKSVVEKFFPQHICAFQLIEQQTD